MQEKIDNNYVYEITKTNKHKKSSESKMFYHTNIIDYRIVIPINSNKNCNN